MPRPTPAAAIVSTQLSVTNWRNRRPGPAPSAVRTAISFCLTSDRPMSRFATFVHAMSSTKLTAAMSVRMTGRS